MTMILVPLDGSSRAEAALPWAISLAKRRAAQLLLVSVVEMPMEFGMWSVSRSPGIGEEVNRWMMDSEEYLRNVGNGLEEVPHDIVVKLGSPAREIAAVLEELDDPMVVMSSHGRTGAPRILMGSVANRIVHDSACPVFVVRYPEGSDRVESASIERVLVPLDGSEFSEHALATMMSALGEVKSIHLLRVVEMPALRAGSALEPGATFDYGLIGEYLDATRDEAVAYLHEQAEAFKDRGLEVSTEVREGRVSDEIRSCAEEQNTDVIAMATHGRGGLNRLVFGSVAERVLSESQIPLLLVRPSQR